MKAMVLHTVRAPLVMEERPLPSPGPGEIRVAVEACAVCRTDLHVVDGDLPHPKLPVIPGPRDRGTGRGARCRRDATRKLGERVGVPWLGHTCGHCAYCVVGTREPVRRAGVHGLHPRRRLRLPCDRRCGLRLRLAGDDDPVALAPLLCAGLIGWRSLVAGGRRRADRHLRLRRGGSHHRPGLHLAGTARSLPSRARATSPRRISPASLGAAWAGGSDEAPPEPLDAAIIFAPVGELVPAGARCRPQGRPRRLRRHSHERHPAFPYRLLWEERQLVSVANLTRQDALDFLAIVPKARIRTQTVRYPLEAANEALHDLRSGRLQGAAVLIP